MLRRFSIKRIVAFFFLDWLGTLAVLGLADSLRGLYGALPAWLSQFLGKIGVPLGGVSEFNAILISPIFFLVALVWPFFLIAFSVYDGRRNESLKAELLNVFLAINVSMLVLAGSLYFTYRGTSRLMLFFFWLLDMVLLLGSRVAWAAYRRSRNGQRQTRLRSVLVVGAGDVGQQVAEQLRRYAWADISVKGYLDDDPQKQSQLIQGMPVLGGLGQAAQVVSAHQIQDAVVALPLPAHERLVEICHILQDRGVHVHVVPDLFALSFPNASLDGYGGIPVIDLGQPGISAQSRLAKRAFDVLAAALSLLILGPLMLLIALLIKLESRGPVIYRQVRIGENGRYFTMFKFRSMRVGSDPGFHQAYVSRLIRENLTPEQLARENGQKSLKMERDPRVTRVGKFLRTTSLDELPQLFNVLRNEMSLVGPRPPLPYEVQLYQDWHKRRLEAMPGITGLWQVNGRNTVSFDEMVRMDLEYIRRQSLGVDLLILLKTPWALITTRGAG